jgi:hypothetical protein
MRGIGARFEFLRVLADKSCMIIFKSISILVLLSFISLTAHAQSRDGIPPGPSIVKEHTEFEMQVLNEILLAFDQELAQSEKKCSGVREQISDTKHNEFTNQFINHYIRFSLLKTIYGEKGCACKENYLQCVFKDPVVRSRLKIIINHPAFYGYVTKAGFEMLEINNFYNILLSEIPSE